MAGPVGRIGTIDVTRGSGEFGQGFYTQTSSSNALSFVQNKFPAAQRPCVLEVNITDPQYKGLTKREFDATKARRLTTRLRRRGTTSTHIERVDVVVGPLNNWIKQHKFESPRSQTELNSVITERRVL